MDKYYNLLYDNVFYERQIILLLSITNPEYLKIKDILSKTSILLKT